MRYRSIGHMRKGALLTEIHISDKPRAVGRKMQYPEKFLASLVLGTLARIQAVLAKGEDQRSFFRVALEAELKRREREAKRKP